ncbi:TolC family protein [Telmatocola sphagniphila]|uniref:TolC family protein n=1 Tax=Telmatocola sphagniphila TaxID=1123043 RepID=A0A8E6B3E5_9BACT|nr:TolC family protein [Telmatocola sphagniphila]QVL30396.1 TolC family protein [Telmatocola sphagniphila]
MPDCYVRYSRNFDLIPPRKVADRETEASLPSIDWFQVVQMPLRCTCLGIGLVLGFLSSAGSAQEPSANLSAKPESLRRTSFQVAIPLFTEENKSAAPTPGEPETKKLIPSVRPNPLVSLTANPNYRPITLTEAVLIANRQGIDALQADRAIDLANAEYQKTRLLWLPNINAGTDYFYHSGATQGADGSLLMNNRQSFMYGVGWNAVFGITDAIYAPIAARRELRARESIKLAINNDLSLSVIEAYFTLLQYAGELATDQMLIIQGEELVRQVGALAEGLVPAVETNRAKVELSRRKQAASTTRERYLYSQADLTRLMRISPTQPLMPSEPSNLKIRLIDPKYSVDELIPIALTNRPELASQQALVQATLDRLRQEKMRPLIPSLAFRSVSTNPSGSLAVGSFSAGSAGNFGSMSGRFDYDIQVIWELQNLGLGNYVRIKEKRTEHEIALLELFRIQDRVAAEVIQAYASVTSAAERLLVAEPAYDEARELLAKNIEAMTQTRRVGNLLTLIVRPQEVVASMQAMAQANSDYQAAIADYNRAQFRLYRALGHPIDTLLSGLR